MKPRRGQVYLHTWHGKPIKKIGCDATFKVASGRSARGRRKQFEREGSRVTRLLAPAPVFAPIMASAFAYEGSEDSRLLKAPYPRNAALFTYSENDVARIKHELSIPKDKKIALYAPTWRPTKYKRGVGYVYNSPIDFQLLQEQLGEEYILLFRGHSNEAKSIMRGGYAEFVHDVTEVMDVNELYIISDVLISDYSGTIFDFANLRRPLVYFLYDWEEYSQEQMGTYFDPRAFPGVVAETQEELPAAIKEAVNNFTYDKQYEEFNQKFNPWEGADAPEQLAKQIINHSDFIEH